MVNIFIGDSHTCGYTSVPGKSGYGSYSMWQENNYAKKYALQENIKSVIYALPGGHSDAYTNWLAWLLQKYENVNKVFISVSGVNRFTLANDQGQFKSDVVPLDHFTVQHVAEDLLDCYSDTPISGDFLQLYQKTISSDYDKFPEVTYNVFDGLISPDLRKNTYMEVKTFLEMNTHLEKQNFLKNVFVWDNLCRLKNVDLYVFRMTENQVFPKDFEYYGPLHNTIVCPESVSGYFSRKNIDHLKYLIEDNEHYNEEYHTLIAEKFLKALTKT